MSTLRRRDEWTEADGDVLWYVEPSVTTDYIGELTDHDMEAYTHWLPLPDVSLPADSRDEDALCVECNQPGDLVEGLCPACWKAVVEGAGGSAVALAVTLPERRGAAPDALGRLEQRVLREMGEGATGKGPEGLRKAIRTLAAALDELDEVVAGNDHG